MIKITKQTSFFVYKLLFCVLSSLTVSALWLPFGFEMGGLIEEWGFLGLYAQHGQFFVIGHPDLLPSFAMRPFTFLMPAIATKLFPNSFVSWHILMILALILKGATVGWWIFRVFGSLLLSLMAVLLLIVYPADTMQLTLRSLHINWALTLVLLGACTLIAALETKQSISAYIKTILAAALCICGIGMYEASIALLLMTPGYFFVKSSYSFFKVTREQTWLIFTFGVCLSLYAVYIINVSDSESSYQSSLLASKNIAVILSSTWTKLFSIGALHVILGGWLDAFKIFIDLPYKNILYITIWLFIFLTILLTLEKRLSVDENVNIQTNNSNSLRLILFGLVMALVGYSPYLLSLPHLSISQRTFLAASTGATLLWLGLISLLLFYKKILAIVIFTVCIILGMTFQLYQFSHYQYLSNLQRKFLSEAVTQYNTKEIKSSILVRDYSNMLGHTWMFLPENIGFALSYIVGKQINSIEICKQPSGEWMRTDHLGRTGHCYETETQWVFEEADITAEPNQPSPIKPRKRVIWPKSSTTLLDIGQDMAQANSEQSNEVDASSIEIPLANTNNLYAPKWPLANIFWESNYRISNCYQWDFGDVWSLEQPTRGNGWREAEWSVSNLTKVSAAWKTSQHGIIYFDLIPESSNYILKFRISAIANDQILKTLSLEINGNKLKPILNELDGSLNIPAGILHKGINSISFDSQTDKNYYGLSIMLDNFTVYPKEGHCIK